jgi:hypothetical protein
MIFALLPYSDGSGPRLSVAFGPDMDADKTLEIHGVGGSILVHTTDIENLIGALRAAQRHIDLEGDA